MRYLALPLDVPIKQRIHHDGAARISKQLAAQADQPAAGHTEFDAYSSVPVIVHVEYFALTSTQLFHDHADELFRHVYGQFFDRLHELAVHALGHDLWFSHHEFEAFAAHHLNQNRKLQFASTHHDE